MSTVTYSNDIPLGTSLVLLAQKMHQLQGELGRAQKSKLSADELVVNLRAQLVEARHGFAQEARVQPETNMRSMLHHLRQTLQGPPVAFRTDGTEHWSREDLQAHDLRAYDVMRGMLTRAAARRQPPLQRSGAVPPIVVEVDSDVEAGGEAEVRTQAKTRVVCEASDETDIEVAGSRTWAERDASLRNEAVDLTVSDDDDDDDDERISIEGFQDLWEMCQ